MKYGRWTVTRIGLVLCILLSGVGSALADRATSSAPAQVGRQTGAAKTTGTAPAGKIAAKRRVATSRPTAETRWEPAIRAFEEADRVSPPPKDAVLFIGSSSMRRWQDIATDLPQAPVINRGFGGSCIPDCTRYIDRIVAPYRPRMVVLQAGDNDIAVGHTAQQVFEDYLEFVRQVRRRLPDVKIAYMSIKPSPKRFANIAIVRETNAKIKKYAAEHDGLVYIDVFTPMMGPDGKPRPELFGPDRLHMTREGYEVWKAVVGPYVAK